MKFIFKPIERVDTKLKLILVDFERLTSLSTLSNIMRLIENYNTVREIDLQSLSHVGVEYVIIRHENYIGHNQALPLMVIRTSFVGFQ